MARPYLFALMFSAATVCSATTFAERVAIAKKIESQKEASEYLSRNFLPALNPGMAQIMFACVVRKNASKDKFTLVANVSPYGDLIDIDFEPKKNNTATCFEGEFGSLKAPPPPSREYGLLPVVLDMSVQLR